MSKELIKNRCPICGYEFDSVEDVNTCPVTHYGINQFLREELITEDDDYMWCY